ncbi:hypothetical protein DMC30DRAFT_415197 [Rhodotorula diobovata]|uniref:Uncharacterized protein n=1 Tax=Rhodotorula diobovata TaxID=5288 RepID=A0A5C5G2Z0_9BASI|nr:hypothetical protein DMC30DRAFT_415197 [Rhodotorula diobovata]
MPNTLPPAGIDAYAAYPVHPAGHGQPGYRKGDDLPAVVSDSTPGSPLEAPASSTRGAHSPAEARSRSPFRIKPGASGDPFFRPESRSQSREPGRAELLQKEAALRQVRAAQDASYEADLERAIRRSKRDAAKSESRERSGSRSRGMSRIRAAIRDLVSDPFWHRASKEEGEHQDEAMRRIILEEVSAARASSTAAASHDRDRARSKSRVRSPLSSQPASRSQSRVRSVVDALAGAGGANSPYDRKAAAGTAEDVDVDAERERERETAGRLALAPAVPTVEPQAAEAAEVADEREKVPAQSPPRGACGMGTYPVPLASNDSLSEGRSRSRPRSPTSLIDSITRAVSRSMSRPRGAATSPGAGPELTPPSQETLLPAVEPTAPPRSRSRSRSREPRGAAGFGDFAKAQRSTSGSRARGAAAASPPPVGEASLPRVDEGREEPRGAAGFGSTTTTTTMRGDAGVGADAGAESGRGRDGERSKPRSGSVSRARAAVGRMWDAVRPQDEVVPDERTWGAAGMGDWKKAKERSQSRGRQQ